MRNSRRNFLKFSAASIAALSVGEGFASTGKTGILQPFHSAIHPTPFVDPLPVPERIRPTGRAGGSDLYRVRMLEFHRRLHSQLPEARLWGYEGSWPGPTFEVMRGQPIEVEWRNELPEHPIFPVDQSLDCCRPPVPLVRAVPHLHGSRTDSASDGLPERWFTPGQ